MDPSGKAREEDLLRRAREGDLNAFSALVEMHEERAVRVAYGLVGHWEDARDLAQDAFVKAYENIGSFEGRSSFFTWFYRILANCCKDFLRKKTVRRHLFAWTPRPDAADPDPASEAVSPERSASQVLQNEELGAAIDQALQRLPERQKSAFRLRYLEGMSLEEIAHGMDLSVGAVKAHLWQAGRKMRAWLLSEGAVGRAE